MKILRRYVEVEPVDAATDTQMLPMTRSYLTYCKRYAARLSAMLDEFQNNLKYEDQISSLITDSDVDKLDDATIVLDRFARRR